MSLQNLGVAVEAVVDGKSLVAEEDGYIVGGEFLEAKQVLTLRVTVNARRNRQPFAAKRDGKGNMVELRDDAPATVDDAIYEISVPISESDKGFVVPAAWPDNFLYVVTRGLEGRFSVIQVSIVSQVGVFFLRVQEMYSGVAWRNQGEFQVGDGEEFGAWAKLLPILEREMRRQKLATAPPPVPQTFSAPTENNIAVVKYFGDAMGFGHCWVNPRQQFRLGGSTFTFASSEVKVHWSQVGGPDRFKCLRPGDVVRFKAVIFRKGARGDHKGQLRPELEGVEIIRRG